MPNGQRGSLRRLATTASIYIRGDERTNLVHDLADGRTNAQLAREYGKALRKFLERECLDR